MKLIAIFTLLLFSFSSHAQEIVPLGKGEPSPFDGVLLDAAATAEIIAKNEVTEEQCTAKTQYEVGKATNSCTLKGEIAETSLKIEKETSANLILLKNQEIERLNKKLEKSGTDWGPLWFAGGSVVGVAMSLTIFFLAVQTVREEPFSG